VGLKRYFPILDWGPRYSRGTFAADLLAAVIVTIMLIPQSLAYAMLAGLPPQVGLYASIAPLALYAIFGTSRALAVGPVAVVSLMTAAAAGAVALPGSPEYLGAAIVLALLSGLFLLGIGLLRLGFLANFLSHPVISGFITAAGLLIAASQLGRLLGVQAAGDTAIEIGRGLMAAAGQVHGPTALIGVGGLALLIGVRAFLRPLLERLGLPARPAAVLARTGPVLVVAASALAVWAMQLDAAGVRIVGDIPRGLPQLVWPTFELATWTALAIPALLLSIVGFVESVSVAQTLAAKRRERIDPDQELVALGASNLGAAFSGGFPVTGGFARSVVNFDAGAATPAAGAYTAVGVALAAVFLTPLIRYLPNAILAATIIVAVLSLVDFKALTRTWSYSRADFSAMAVTIALTLLMGVEAGIVAGVGLSLALYLYRGSRPHVAIVGQVPGTEHFRNVLRHPVETVAGILTVRVDESLFFANARYLEDTVYDLIAKDPAVRHFVLMCSAVNEIDASALESLEAINARLKDAGVAFHLSEVKGPVMDRLQRSHFLEALTGRVFLSQHEAMSQLKALMRTPVDPQANLGANI